MTQKHRRDNGYVSTGHVLFRRLSVYQASQCLLSIAQRTLGDKKNSVALNLHAFSFRPFEAQISRKKYLKIQSHLTVNTSRVHYKGQSVEVV